MKRVFLCVCMLIAWLGTTATLFSQTEEPDRITVPFSDPSRPGTVKVNVLFGSVSVKGYAGKEVLVELQERGRSEQSESPRRGQEKAAGLKRIPNLTRDLVVSEENNTVTISTGPPQRVVGLVISVPSRTDLKLKAVNGGGITVEQVQGDIEVDNTNGPVTLTTVSGSVVAHALNSEVKAVLTEVDPGKPMSFSSLNGDIDVTMPANVKANLSMQSFKGEIYSDFEIKLAPQEHGRTDWRRMGGKSVMKMDQSTKGTINGGGAEIQLKTFNGSIYIRKSS